MQVYVVALDGNYSELEYDKKTDTWFDKDGEMNIVLNNIDSRPDYGNRKDIRIVFSQMELMATVMTLKWVKNNTEILQ